MSAKPVRIFITYTRLVDAARWDEAFGTGTDAEGINRHAQRWTKELLDAWLTRMAFMEGDQ